jgi:hypothetical protein
MTAAGERRLQLFSPGEGAGFEDRSDALRTPVHIRALGGGFAPGAWSLEGLQQLAGDCRFKVARNDERGQWVVNKDGRQGADWKEVSLAEFIGALASGDHGFYAGSVAIDRFPPLLRDATRVPLLDWVGNPEAVQIRLWLGRSNATQLHYDMFHTFLVPIIGWKDVWLFAPTALDGFYPMQDARNCNVSQVVSPKQFDRAAFPAFETKPAIRVRLHPGGALFIPIYWWHYVEAGSDANLALSYHFTRPTVETLRSEYLLHYVRAQASANAAAAAAS